MTGYLFLIGLISLLAQVILLRELNVAFYGIELIYLLAIGTWLLGTGLGSVLGRRSPSSAVLPLRGMLLILSIYLLLDVALIRGLRLLFGAVPGAYLPFLFQILGMGLTVLPVSALLGLLFAWAAKIYIAEGRTLALTYGVECAGGVVGGLAATGLMRYGVQNWTAALACALIAAGCAVFSIRDCQSASRRGYRFIGGVWVILLLAMMATSANVDRYMTAWNHPFVVASQDSPYGRITIDRLQDQLAVFENDVLSYENQGTSAQALAHLAALSHPNPRKILLLGGGVYGMLPQLVQHHPTKIVYVEIDAVLLKLITPFLPDHENTLLNDPRVKVRITDPRLFLQKATENYDLILIAMPEPSSGQASRFYTKEFFRRCAAHLELGGRLAFQIRSAENFWTEQLARRAASIYLALRSAGLNVLVLPGASDIFLAGDSQSINPLAPDPQTYLQRYHDRAIQASLVTPDYVRYRLTNDRVQKAGRLLEAEIVPINSDNHPICFYYALLIWLSKFFPALFYSGSTVFMAQDTGRAIIWAVMAAISLVTILVVRRRAPLRRTLLAAMAGFCGMVVESVLLLNYQMKRGVLYQDIGLLLTLFMVGLTLGAMGADRMFIHRAIRFDRNGSAFGPQSSRAGEPGEVKSKTGIYGIVMVSAFGGVGLISGLVTADYFFKALFWTGTLLTCAGAFVAMIFTYSGLIGAPAPQKVIAPLYGADLIGGAMGAWIGSLVLIPFTGLSTTALLTSFLCLMTVFLL